MSSEGDQSRILKMPISPMVVDPVTLDGQFIRLEPLTMDHYDGLCKVALDAELWRWIPFPVKNRADMQVYITQASKLFAEGSVLPFATIHKPSNQIVGTTRFMSIDTLHHNIEIGSTIIGKYWQRTVVNTEAKYLMLSYAFETLGCIRVQLQTDALNVKSRNAILRLGATQEAVFRNHRICADGRIRNTLFFSITDEDWPRVKANLVDKLALPYLPKS